MYDIRLFALICTYLLILNVVLYYYDCVKIMIILYFLNYNYNCFKWNLCLDVYMYSVCVIIYGNKDDDDDDDYYYYYKEYTMNVINVKQMPLLVDPPLVLPLSLMSELY